MAVAFDAFTAITGAVDPSGTHTPVGTPRGILAFIVHQTAEAVTAATYGGNSFGTAIATFANSVGAEMTGISITAYLLGSSVPTGAQTVAFTTGASGGTPYVYSVTATGDVEFIDDATIESTAIENPTTTLALGGRTCFVAETWLSGQGAPAGATPLTDWNSRSEADLGSLIQGTYSYDIIGSTDVTVGLTQGIDDILLLAVAISEIPGSATSSKRPSRRTLLGVG